MNVTLRKHSTTQETERQGQHDHAPRTTNPKGTTSTREGMNRWWLLLFLEPLDWGRGS